MFQRTINITTSHHENQGSDRTSLKKTRKVKDKDYLSVSTGKSHESLPKGLNFVEIYDFRLLDTTCNGTYLVIAPSRSCIIHSSRSSNMLLG